jgi:hypothetical protein
VIPANRNEVPVACLTWADSNRNIIERLWARLKERRAVATELTRRPPDPFGVLCFADAPNGIRHE